MDPITGQIFSYDFQRFVLQDPLINAPKPKATQKPFDLNMKGPEKTDKTKKDMKKEEKQEKKKEKPNFKNLM